MGQTDSQPILAAEAELGETPADAIRRLRRGMPLTRSIHLRHNGIALTIHPAVSPEDAEEAFRRERDLRDAERRAATLPLVAGPYSRVKVGALLPDVILIGPNRVRYVLVRDPDTEERLCYVWVPGEGDDG